jgi:hypothetical protein
MINGFNRISLALALKEWSVFSTDKQSQSQLILVESGLTRGVPPLISSILPHLLSLLNQNDRCICLRNSKYNDGETEPSEDGENPIHPSPVLEYALAGSGRKQDATYSP